MFLFVWLLFCLVLFLFFGWLVVLSVCLFLCCLVLFFTQMPCYVYCWKVFFNIKFLHEEFCHYINPFQWCTQFHKQLPFIYAYCISLRRYLWCHQGPGGTTRPSWHCQKPPSTQWGLGTGVDPDQEPSFYPDLEPSFSSAQGCQSLPEVHSHLVTSGLSTGPMPSPTCPVCRAGVLQEARASQAPGLKSQPQLCSALPGASTGDAESWTRKIIRNIV